MASSAAALASNAEHALVAVVGQGPADSSPTLSFQSDATCCPDARERAQDAWDGESLPQELQRGLQSYPLTA